MKIVAQVAQALQAVLTEAADRLARTSGFIQRMRQVTGSGFVQGLVLGWMANPNATMEQLCQSLAAAGVQISAPGLDQRFTPEAAALVRQVLEEATRQVVVAEPVPLEIVQRFSGIYVQDSTQVQLPEQLAAIWPGCSGATLKLQVRWDLRQGAITDLELQPGREHDQKAALFTTPVPAGGLHLRDLGYFNLKQLQQIDAARSYYVTRPKAHTVFYDEQGREWHFDAFLLAHKGIDQIDIPIQLGAHERVPARLVAQRVPSKIAAERRRKLRAEAKRKQQPVSQYRLVMCDWIVLVTNCPVALLSLDDVLVLARARWQVELLFKFWKSQAGIDAWRSEKPWRILCELYAKLIGVLIQHWIWITGAWGFPDRSLFKAGATLRTLAPVVAVALASGIRCRLLDAIRTLHTCLRAGCRIDKSRQNPRTFQLLQDLCHETQT